MGKGENIFSVKTRSAPYQDNSPQTTAPWKTPLAYSPGTIAPIEIAPGDNYPLDNYSKRQIAPSQ